MSAKIHPALNPVPPVYRVTRRLVADRVIWVSDNGTLVGTATDGTNVQVGHLLSLPATEAYLTSNPSPESW